MCSDSGELVAAPFAGSIDSPTLYDEGFLTSLLERYLLSQEKNRKKSYWLQGVSK
jgi:hypothetical protein